MRTAEFVFDFETIKEAKIVAESLSPELNQKIPKTNISISVENKKLTLKVNSPDISSLRAACNSYLRWINTAISVKKIV